MSVRPAPAFVLASLVDDDLDLATRVDRLLRQQAHTRRLLAPLAPITRKAMLIVCVVFATLMLWPSGLGGIHQLFECLLQSVPPRGRIDFRFFPSAASPAVLVTGAG
jgi:hypothetical protein